MTIHLAVTAAVLSVVFLGVSPASVEASPDPMVEAFKSPADGTRPRCYWYWLDNHVSQQGITADLEAMQRVGIGGAFIGIIHDQSSLREVPEPAALSDAWWHNITHAVHEGKRLGIAIGFFNSPAWSQSGGPWVKTPDAMRYLVTRELRAKGPGKVTQKLGAAGEKFTPIAVHAFPVPAGEDGLIPEETRTPSAVTLRFASPIVARSIQVEPTDALDVTAKVEASDDGVHWRDVTEFRVDRNHLKTIVGPIPLAAKVVAIPATRASQFRVTFSAPSAFGTVKVSPAARVDDVMGKQLAKMFEDPQPPFDFYTWPLLAEPDDAKTIVARESVKLITDRVAADGTVEWEVPVGDWLIVQTAMTPTSTVNSPASPPLTGLEIDKMKRGALDRHFDAYVGELLRRLPEADRAGLTHIVADSYEVGPQNWTDGLELTFKNRYGYDPLPFLPVLTGRVIGSVDQSDRFLWDLRRLIADEIARNYVGGLRERCNQSGMKVWFENYGHWGYPAEFLQYGGASDEVGGEFWQYGSGTFEGLGSIELRDASSCAHTYGKNVVWAEAFTGGPKFTNGPRDLKARGDWAFCQGINQFVLHVAIHQPDNRTPGVSAWFGTEFNRANTWFEMSKAWFDYQRRCSTLLQQGVHVADVAYFIGEDTPKMTGPNEPALPKGYDFDFINAEVLLKRASVKDRRLVLPDGMSYRVLVLPRSQTMRPAVLKQIASFVDAGLTVVGPLPKRSPSLEGYPQCDADVAALATKLSGRVDESADLKKAIAAPADVGGLPDNVLFIHRHSEDVEIYFLSNQSDMAITFHPTFRVTERSAELWRPETGEIESLTTEPQEAATRATIDLEPSGSVFVVFRKPGAITELRSKQTSSTRPTLSVLAAKYEGVDGGGNADVTSRLGESVSEGRLRMMATNKTLGGDPAFKHNKQVRIEYTLDGRPFKAVVPENGYIDLPAGVPLPGPWTVAFPHKTIELRELSSWSLNTDASIRYFSGTASYRTSFRAKPGDGPISLRLGNVESIAQVTLNGKVFDAVWTRPYVVDVTSAIRLGENTLEIRVVNPWYNALVGLVQNPDAMAKPLPWTSTMPRVDPDTPLQPAGLLGPVGIAGAELE